MDEMRADGPGAGRYHVLLIGCDAYAPPQRSLAGCVNDIDAVEDLVLGEPGIGRPTESIVLTRLAAPAPGAFSRSRYADSTTLPTKGNIVAALEALARPHVGAGDSVLVYYSGHGGQVERSTREGWFECLVGVDNEALFDDELNALIEAISRRTEDVTVVLDCCHSAGATREAFGEPDHGASRVAEVVTLPADDAGEPGGSDGRAAARDWPPPRLLQATDPPYLVVAACHADEKAQEDLLGATSHGFLTWGLLEALSGVPPERRPGVRWVDVWPRVLDNIWRVATETKRTMQHPWTIGRAERHVFGGPFKRQDAGWPVSRGPDGRFRIAAGTLVGFTPGATVAIYGAEPDLFPAPDSDEDRAARRAEATVESADRSSAVASPTSGGGDSLPDGARARLVHPGPAERLRVWLDRAEPDPAPALEGAGAFELLDGPETLAEVAVHRSADGWTLGNDTNEAIALVRLSPGASADQLAGAHAQLVDALEAYARYNTALRTARNAHDPELDQALRVSLLDCSDDAMVEQADPKRPSLPELSRNARGIHEVAPEQAYCISVANFSARTLDVTVFNCSAFGLVEWLGELSLRGGDVGTVWRGEIQRQPFHAVPDDETRDTTDRIVAIATTKPGISLRGLEVSETIQEVIDGGERSSMRRRAEPELWTAVVEPLRIAVREPIPKR